MVALAGLQRHLRLHVDGLAADRNLDGVVAEDLQHLGADHAARLQHDRRGRCRRRGLRANLRNALIDDNRHAPDSREPPTLAE